MSESDSYEVNKFELKKFVDDILDEQMSQFRVDMEREIADAFKGVRTQIDEQSEQLRKMSLKTNSLKGHFDVVSCDFPLHPMSVDSVAWALKMNPPTASAVFRGDRSSQGCG